MSVLTTVCRVKRALRWSFIIHTYTRDFLVSEVSSKNMRALMQWTKEHLHRCNFAALVKNGMVQFLFPEAEFERYLSKNNLPPKPGRFRAASISFYYRVTEFKPDQPCASE